MICILMVINHKTFLNLNNGSIIQNISNMAYYESQTLLFNIRIKSYLQTKHFYINVNVFQKSQKMSQISFYS